MSQMLLVSLILFMIWGFFYYINRKKISSGKIYFLMLLCMILPPTLNDEPLDKSWFHDVELSNIAILALCLCAGFIPWLVFDKNIKGKRFQINDDAVQVLKIFFTVLILWSLYSIIYLTPYAVRSLALGAHDTRNLLYSGKAEILPPNFLTTIAVAGSACYIYAILFFYMACLSPQLKSYRIWLAMSSLSYLFNCLAFTARDGLIFIPLLYLIFFLALKPSLNFKITQTIKKRILIIIASAFILLMTFSLSRFAGSGSKTDWASVYSGTFGYMNQQPYVFDATIEGQDDFWGFEVRFPIINRLIGIEEHEVNRRDNSFEWSFGTMYAEHYSAFGWLGLVLITLVTVLFFGLGISNLFRRRRYFGAFMLFNVYCFISVSGMFYTRAGSNVSMNIFYLLLSFLPFFIPKWMSCKRIN